MAHKPHHLQLPPIPDLRFEYTYLRSISPYLGDSTDHAYGAGHVAWRKIAWVTTRDQVISPLVQGVLWGTLFPFFQPLLGLLVLRPKKEPAKVDGEGYGVGRLRSWLKNLGF